MGVVGSHTTGSIYLRGEESSRLQCETDDTSDRHMPRLSLHVFLLSKFVRNRMGMLHFPSFGSLLPYGLFFTSF